MFKHSLTAKRILLNAFLPTVVALALATGSLARPQDPAERQRAIDLYEANNFVAALPLLEKVAASSPNDPVILSRLGFALYANSVDEKDPTLRQKMRERARNTLLRSQSLGDSSNLTKITVDALSAPDASQIPFSNIKAAETAIRDGEAAFMRGDMDKAIAAYKRALELDPQLYDAALYAGDAEFKKGNNSTDAQFRSEQFDKAGAWFAKAIAIDANRETAYRYWGDALNAQGKSNEARDKFVDAIVAQPYSRQAYVGLTQWADGHKVPLGHPNIRPPNSTNTQGGQTTLSIDPKILNRNDGSNEWLMYDLTRIAWAKGDFFKNYPDEKEYRHSLKEEAAALRMVAEFAAKDLKSGKIKALEPSLAMLVKLNEDGFLEAYVLFAHPDQGIARDYASYRKDNREKLRRYWLEVVISRS
ncbi:MAG TPA: tetratricopeptide repeat protein [Pyrinomonadaceae bacterium]|nr:tetratricopeptide repeat protein [Pyrinomonadaceae bacterium]